MLIMNKLTTTPYTARLSTPRPQFMGKLDLSSYKVSLVDLDNQSRGQVQLTDLKHTAKTSDDYGLMDGNIIIDDNLNQHIQWQDWSNWNHFEYKDFFLEEGKDSQADYIRECKAFIKDSEYRRHTYGADVARDDENTFIFTKYEYNFDEGSKKGLYREQKGKLTLKG